MSEDSFEAQLLAAFRLEAKDHITLLQNNFVAMESLEGESALPLIEQSFRSLHNLKGSAHAVELFKVESLCHPMEDIMMAAKNGDRKLTSQMLDLLLEGTNIVGRLIAGEDETSCSSEVESLLKRLYAANSTRTGAPAATTASDILGSLASASISASAPSTSAAGPVAPYMVPTAAASGVAESVLASTALDSATRSRHHGDAVSAGPGSSSVQTQATGRTAVADKPKREKETLRISVDKLDEFLQNAEEMLSLKAMVRQNASKTGELLGRMEHYLSSWSKSAPELRQARSLLDGMVASATNPYEELLWRKVSHVLETHGKLLTSMTTDMRELARAESDSSFSTASYVDTLIDETKKLLFLPCSTLFEGTPLLVRQLTKQLNKSAELTISGGEIEVDKRILAQLKDPIIHLLRNSIDHGIEPPEVRDAAGKPSRGSLSITVKQKEGMVELRISDDGRGIDAEKVAASAVKKGIISKSDVGKLTAPEALRLIFKSSLSTSPLITEISGRGVGLAIVEERIEQLGGTLEVLTEKGRGTTFVLCVPLMIATFRGVLIQAGTKIFVLPTISAERVILVDPQDIKPVEGMDTIIVDGAVVPLCSMENALHLPPSHSARGEGEPYMVTVLKSGSDKVAFVVDEVLSEQEVLVKQLGPVFSGNTAVSGVTILGSGQVAPILNVPELIEAVRKQPVPAAPRAMVAQKGEAGSKAQTKRIRVLAVDDMVTARMLMRNILETSGFAVKLANDGLEALTFLRAEPFDIVVTDMEMPRMDGIELTKAIRADADLSSLPVVLVTNMTSQKDRERGVDAGANAYFVKSNFDQSNLLEVITRLAL